MYNPQLMIDVSRALMEQRLRDAQASHSVDPVEGRAGPVVRARRGLGNGLIAIGTRLAYGTRATLPNC